MVYSPELKEAMLRRLLPPNNESVTKISREEGIPQGTLTRWKNEAKANGIAAPTGDDAETWSTQDKFLIVVETASMNETELAEYARQKGLYVEQIKAWKDACMLSALPTEGRSHMTYTMEAQSIQKLFIKSLHFSTLKISK